MSIFVLSTVRHHWPAIRLRGISVNIFQMFYVLTSIRYAARLGEPRCPVYSILVSLCFRFHEFPLTKPFFLEIDFSTSGDRVEMPAGGTFGSREEKKAETRGWYNHRAYLISSTNRPLSRLCLVNDRIARVRGRCSDVRVLTLSSPYAGCLD